MIGTPATHFGKFSDGDYGFILVVDIDDLFLESIESVIFQTTLDSSNTKTISSESSLTTLSDLVSDEDADTPAWYKSSSLLYLFFPTSLYSYVSTTLFTVLGTRVGIPIESLETSYLDVPEKHLELFLKYTIKEAAQLLGKQVPPSVINDITELESNV